MQLIYVFIIFIKGFKGKIMKNIITFEKAKQLLKEKNNRMTNAEKAFLGVISNPTGKSIRKDAQPSLDIPPEKAKQILREGTAKGKPLTEKQKDMFGAAAGRAKS